MSAQKTIAELERLVGPPEGTRIATDWQAVEDWFGLAFPADYKALCDAFPPIGVGPYLAVNHAGLIFERGNPALLPGPFGVRDIQFVMSAEGEIRLIQPDGGLVESEPLPCHPKTPGLLRWGTSEELSYLWLTDADPARWSVLVTDQDRWWRYPGGMLELIVSLFRGENVCPLLPRGWRREAVMEYHRDIDGWRRKTSA